MYYNKVEICGVNTASLAVLDDDEKKGLLERIKEGDSNARQELICGNLRLVLSTIRKFIGKKESADDLFQVGCIGLVKAVDNFNTELDVKFSTYAVPMIIGEVRRYLRDNNAIRISRSIRDLAYRALQAREAIQSEKECEPTVDEIARRIGSEKEDIVSAMEAIVEPVSLYDSVFGDGEDSMYVIDQLSDETKSDEILIENIALKEALKKLNEREKGIITRRYYRGKTQMEIAAEIGISQAQVSRIEKGAIDKLRKYME